VPVGAAPALAVTVAAAVGVVVAARMPQIDPAAAGREAAVLCHSLPEWHSRAAGQLVLADLTKMLGGAAAKCPCMAVSFVS